MSKGLGKIERRVLNSLLHSKDSLKRQELFTLVENRCYKTEPLDKKEKNCRRSSISRAIHSLIKNGYIQKENLNFSLLS